LVRKKADFWALEGISLKIKKGETLGIIGRNGSGKTTLLRLILKITQPTRGKIRLNGRIAGLLELGAGFHQDLTGRENIYLNGYVLGLKKREITGQIDSIIDFADIGDFIDAPVRTYSSGMYLRLGFAIAVHIDPEVLIIDEVLAVGDVGFQEKCLGKINEYKKNNKTLILVTQNTEAIKQLCDNVVWMEAGRIIKQGKAAETVEEYEISTQKNRF